MSGAPVSHGASRFEVRGSLQLGEEELSRIVSATAASGVNAVAKAVQSAYIERGFLAATIRIETQTADSTILLVVDEGAPTLYGSVGVRGVALVSETGAREIVGLRTGDRYDSEALKAGFQKLLEFYDESGYPFTRVWVDSLAFDDRRNRVNLSIYVVEGGLKTIRRVEFEGLEHTRKDLAMKLSGLKAGEPYDGERIRDSYLRLTSSGVFDEVSYPSVRLAQDANGVEALIKVLEPKGRNSASGALGYADREGGSDRVLSGLVRLDLTNMGGSLRDLHVLWKNDGQGRQETRLGFRDRFFLGRRVGLGVTLEQTGLDTLYTWQSLGVESWAPVGRLWGGLVGVRGGAYGDRNTFSQGDASSSLRFRMNGGVEYARGDEDRGMFFDFTTGHTYGRKEMDLRSGNSGGTVSQYTIEVRTRATADIGASAHGMLELVYRGIESSEEFVPLSEQFYIGGAGTVRGYRENQFHGRQVGYARCEIRAGRSRRENGYVFVDAGYVLQETQDASEAVSRKKELPVGFGFGLRTESKLGNVDISFGVGDEISLRQTKVHVILNRTF
jgi:outer membrane protein assembly factor BamA